MSFPPLKKQSKLAAVPWQSIFNTYGAKASFSFEVGFNTCQLNADCASCSIEAIPSETRKTDKVMLDRTYYAKLGENLGTGTGMKVCLGAKFGGQLQQFATTFSCVEAELAANIQMGTNGKLRTDDKEGEEVKKEDRVIHAGIACVL